MIASRFTLLGLALLAALPALACGSSTPESTPAADAGPSGATPANTAPSGPTGSNCTGITETYSVCQDLSTCPGVSIDQTKFPQCGYAIHGDSIDPECLCYGSMCPMGAPATCADMAAILSSTTLSIVCERQATGHCTNMGGQGTVTACQVCKQNCGGDPACLQNCGC